MPTLQNQLSMQLSVNLPDGKSVHLHPFNTKLDDGSDKPADRFDLSDVPESGHVKELLDAGHLKELKPEVASGAKAPARVLSEKVKPSQDDNK